jgi:ferric-dicitrate binding protein FerR (iron transport regulator)
MGAVLDAECERARSWASLGLDAELSQIEQLKLRAHVGRCAACAAFAQDLERVVEELRRAPLEQSTTVVMPVVRRSATRRGLQLGAAAAAVAIAASLGSLAGSLSSREPASTVATSSFQFPMQAFRVAVLRPTILPGTRLQKSEPV